MYKTPTAARQEMDMHYTYGGKHIGQADHTLHVADVTCGNCVRTRAFRVAMDSANAITATTDAVQAASDAGFFTSFKSHNHVIGANYSITSIDRFGLSVTYGNGERVTFPTLVDFLTWITPADMPRVIEHVTNGDMTWTAAMDYEWSLAEEVKSVEAIGSALNLITAERVAAPFSPRPELMDRIRNLSAGDRIKSGADTGTVVAESGNQVMVKFDQPIKGSGTTVAVNRSKVEEYVIPDEDKFSWGEVIAAYRESHPIGNPVVAEDIPAPFRTRGKVKSTSRARRFRKGA